MKKSAIILAIGAVALGVTGCKQNTMPQFQEATEFQLNTPPMANQTFELSDDALIPLTWSQPNWGFPALANYEVQIALNDQFADGAYYSCPTIFNICTADVKGSEVAAGINKLRGIGDLIDYKQEPAAPVYMRVRAWIDQVAESQIYSNVICLKSVASYPIVLAPNKIYLVGAPEGWAVPEEANAAHYNDWALREAEDAIGSNIFSGTFAIGAGDKAIFRFYTKLTGWDADSYGAPGGNDDDNPVKFENAFAGGAEFNSLVIKTKDSFSFPNWEGGNLTITVDMADNPYTVKMVPVE